MIPMWKCLLGFSDAKAVTLSSGLVICTREFSNNFIILGAWNQPYLNGGKKLNNLELCPNRSSLFA